MSQFQFYVVITIFLFWSGCQPVKDKVISNKNNCYQKKLIALKNSYSNRFNQIHKSFQSTYYEFKKSLLEEKIDDAIFFNTDSSECLLIVLERNKTGDGLFGSATIFRGTFTDRKWEFKQSISFDFGRDYFEKFPDNTFDNISQLARYSVLTEGKVDLEGCEIDEYYWFTYLKE